MENTKSLLAITELGGYPDFRSLYNGCGFEVEQVTSMRKALRSLKQSKFDVIIAEFNFQSDFRDRTSNLESLLAVVERKDDCRLIVFYEQDYAHQLERLRQQYQPHATLPFPIDTEKLNSAL